MESVASKLSIGSAQTVHNWVHNWVRKAQVDAGLRSGVTSDESAELWKLKAEIQKLWRANEILKAASAFVCPEQQSPPV